LNYENKISGVGRLRHDEILVFILLQCLDHDSLHLSCCVQHILRNVGGDFPLLNVDVFAENAVNSSQLVDDVLGVASGGGNSVSAGI